MSDIIWIILAALLILVGAIGTIAPVLPGVPLSWGGLLVLKFLPSTKDSISWKVIVALGVLTLAITILDNLLPIWGTKRMGGSKTVVWGSAIGLLVGFFLGPLGIIFGPFVGALISGVIVGNELGSATRQAAGAFIGYLTGLLLKLVVVGLIIYYFVITLLA